MRKRVALLALLIIAAFNSAWAFDFYAVCSTGQTLYYNITDVNNHYVEVTCPGMNNWTGYTKPTGNLTIPSSVSHSGSTYSVKAVGACAFYECENITNLTFPNTIISIGASAFDEVGITNLSLPSSLQSIDNFAFFGAGVTTINFPNSLMALGQNVFLLTPWYNNQPNGLVYAGPVLYNYKGEMPPSTSITIPSGTKGIAGGAFSQCSNLVSISLPNTLQSIGQDAFYACTGLTSITIPSSVVSISGGAFRQCGMLSSVQYNAQNCITRDYGASYHVFEGCYSLSTLSIGNNVQTIPDELFYGCNSLSGALSLPSSLKYIGWLAFYNCSGFSGSLTIPTQMDSIGMGAFNGCTGFTSLNYNATNMYNSLYSGGIFSLCSSIASLTIGNNVVSLPDMIFAGCSNITGSVTIPNSVTSIGTGAFVNCSGIETITIGTSVSTLHGSPFGGMDNLQSVNYNAINCQDGGYLFSGINSLTSVVIGNNVQRIPTYFVVSCPNLHSITIPSSVTTIADYALFNNGFTGTLTIPQSVNTIGSIAFGALYNLTDIEVLSSNPPTCGTNAFSGTSYYIPLIVPCGAVSAYQNAPEWSTFTTIQEGAGCSHQISVSANPSNGGSVSGGGTYNSGSNCTVTANASSNYCFINWTENGAQVSTNPSYSFTVNSDRTLVANFQYEPTVYTINASANPSNGGTVTGTGNYNQGQTCTLTAIPNTGFSFLKWTENGSQVSTNPTYSFTVNGNRTLVAHFQNIPNQYTITVSANPSNGGTVSGGGTYQQGQTCTVTANANSNYNFVNWTENGTQVSTNSTYSFTVTGNRTLVANFSYVPTGYTINATAEPSYGGMVSGAGTYNQGQTCTLTATPNPNYNFVNWTENGNVVSTNATYSFTVNGNRTLVAHFESQVFTITAYSEPSEGGTVYGGGTYSGGITCHLIAVPNNNYSFLNWTENGVVVSSDSDYSFVVTGNRTLVANFFYYDAVEEDAANDIMVYPNPTNDVVFIKGCNIRKVELYDLMGQMLVSKERHEAETSISIKHLSSGLYLLRVYSDNDIVIVRVSKE